MRICLRSEEKTPTLISAKTFLRRLIMNHHQKHLSACLIALAALFSTAPIGAWAATAPALNSASGYAVLSAGTATTPSSTVADPTAMVTTTGSTTNGNNGNVGSAGGVTLTSSAISGNVVHTGAFVNTGSTPAIGSASDITPLPIGVINDFNTAYGNYAAIPCTTTFAEDAPGAGNTYTGNVPAIGPLAPGVYCFHTAVTFTNTTLTLTGAPNGVWIFKVGIDGTGALTSTDSSVVMAGGNACNVSWWVAQAATITRGSFQGYILAGAAITMTGVAGAPSSFNGDALANGKVKLTDMNVTSCGAGGGGNDNDGDGNDKDKDHHDKDHHDKDKDHK